MKNAVDYMREALAQLEASRNELDGQIAVIRRTIAELSDLQPKPATGPVRSGPPARSVRDVALQVASRGTVFGLGDVIDALRVEGNESQYASVSSILSRLANEGVLLRGPRRGTYQAVTSDGGSDSAEPPSESEGGGDADAPSVGTDWKL